MSSKTRLQNHPFADRGKKLSPHHTPLGTRVAKRGCSTAQQLRKRTTVSQICRKVAIEVFLERSIVEAENLQRNSWQQCQIDSLTSLIWKLCHIVAGHKTLPLNITKAQIYLTSRLLLSTLQHSKLENNMLKKPRNFRQLREPRGFDRVPWRPVKDH